MAILNNIKLHQQKKQAINPEERTITPLQARYTPESAQQAVNVKPTDAVDPKSQYLSFERTGIVSAPGTQTRANDLANMDEQAFIANQDKLNASGKEYWAAQVKKDPTNVYAAVNEYLASSETPEEKRKRERREAVGEAINGLGNLIGNVANMYYAPRSGYHIDLNTYNEKQKERMERIQAKRDALDQQRQQLILNTKIGQMNAERQAQIAADKDAADKAWKIKYDAFIKDLDNAHELGQIDAQTKAEHAKIAAKSKSDKELESIRQQNRIALKTTPSYGEDKVITSLTGSDGGTWTRNTSLSEEEIRELAKYVEDWSPYTTINEETGEKKTDYIGAIADASDSGVIPDYVLEEKGFKRSKDSDRRKGKSLPGVETKGKSKHLNL